MLENQPQSKMSSSDSFSSDSSGDSSVLQELPSDVSGEELSGSSSDEATSSAGIMPYQFEPQVSPAERRDSDDSDNNSSVEEEEFPQLANLDW